MAFVDISQLGKRVERRTVVEPVEDPYTKTMTIKQTVKSVEYISPLLTLDEAKQLEGVKWEPFEPVPGQWKAVAGGRRFIIEAETYAALFPPPEIVNEPEPKSKKGKKADGVQ